MTANTMSRALRGRPARKLDNVAALDAIQQALSTMRNFNEAIDEITRIVRLTGREVF